MFGKGPFKHLREISKPGAARSCHGAQQPLVGAWTNSSSSSGKGSTTKLCRHDQA